MNILFSHRIKKPPKEGDIKRRHICYAYKDWQP